MKRLRKEIVSAVRSDKAVQEAQLTVHHCVTMPPASVIPTVERETKGEAEYVEGGSVAMRSGAGQHSRMHPLYGLGFGPKETSPVGVKASGTSSLTNRLSKDKTFLHKKAKQHSSELAEPRRLPTASFGFERKQKTESCATQVVDSYPEFGGCGAQATQETKRKLNPFVESCGASATEMNAPKGIMPPPRMHGLALPEPLTLDKFVALIMSRSGASRNPNLNKTRLHPQQTRVNPQILTLPMSTSSNCLMTKIIDKPIQTPTNIGSNPEPNWHTCTHMSAPSRTYIHYELLGPIKRGRTFF